jgi:hypothetical protein
MSLSAFLGVPNLSQLVQEFVVDARVVSLMQQEQEEEMHRYY